jgi:predicted transcriptional regulator with HTH domain
MSEYFIKTLEVKTQNGLKYYMITREGKNVEISYAEYCDIKSGNLRIKSYLKKIHNLV